MLRIIMVIGMLMPMQLHSVKVTQPDSYTTGGDVMQVVAGIMDHNAPGSATPAKQNSPYTLGREAATAR